MPVSFQSIEKGTRYSRQRLAEIWGYQSFHAIARGLVTPRDDNKLILFITEGEGQQPTTQRYSNHFDGHTLTIDGPEDHFAEDRTVNARANSDEIHLFHREHPRDDFTYHGRVRLVAHRLYTDRPSRFTFELE